MKIRLYRKTDLESLIGLWRDCGLVKPQNDPAKDIDRKLKANAGWLLVGEEQGVLVASVMVGYDGHRGWINYLAVSPDFQKKGLGRQMMERAEKELNKVGCAKINLQVRKVNRAVLGFYRSLGFVDDKVISLGKRLVDDSGQGRPKRV